MKNSNANQVNKLKKSHQGKSVIKCDPYNVIDCIDCGFKHVYPLPDHNKINKIYQKEYYSNVKPDYIISQLKDYDWWYQNNTKLLFEIKKIILSDGNRFLDIGSGPGLMLKAATDNGWDALGVEPNTIAADFSISNGGNVLNDFFSSEILDKIGVFDAIYCSEVIEHVIDPSEFIMMIKSITKPGGVICIIVPNDFNPLQSAIVDGFKLRKWWVVPPHHLNYFSHSSLFKLVEKIGFQVLNLSSTFPIELFLAMGDNYIDNEELGSFCHQKRVTMEKLLFNSEFKDLFSELYKKFSELGIGREIVLLARKPY